jgi:pimeloyl-ACP methyl ester carboxylesterase
MKSDPRLYYELHGTRGPGLLMVHGLMSSRAQWIPNLKTFAAFCRPVVVELFGHGRSPSPEDPEAYYPENYIREFEAIRREIGLEQWFICGQSLGAALTLRYSLLHPERTTAQIFTNSRSALSEVREGQSMERMVKSMLERGRSSLDGFPLNPSQSRYLEPAVKKALAEDIDLIDLEGFANNLLHLIPTCSVRQLLRGIGVPTLLVAGKLDRAFSPLISIALTDIPALECVEVNGGHAVNIDAAEEFNRVVLDFLRRHNRSDRLS